MMRKLRILLPVACCLLSAVILTGCGRKESVRDIAIPVEVVAVEKGDLKETLFFVGDIKARNQIEVYPRVSGKLLENVVKEGQRITEDGIIAYIDRDEVGFEFEKAPVTSPIEGIVGNVYLDKGANVSPQVAIAKIVDMDVVKIRINVIERDLPKVKEGQLAQVKVDAYPNEVFKGIVERVSPVVDINSRTALAEINISNPDYKLKPGMFARVNLISREKNSALFISRDSIVRGNEGSLNYVFVIQGNRAYKRRVDLGIQEGLKFEVIGGLKQADLVVITGEEYLKDGSLVIVVK
jgi:membrane fusion protein (multidrug efflux system)